MRTHGWGGDPPATDDEAIDRILAATRRCIDNEGTATSIVGVAHALGVTRQTVYRYFASTEDLLTATAINAAGGFLDRLATHVAPLDDPADAVVEAIAFTLEQLMCEPYLNLLLTSGRVSAFALGVTSEISIAFGRSVIERFSVNWPEAGFDDQLLTELVEHVLRTIQSLALHPVHPERDGAALRGHLTRWVAPSVQHMAGVAH